MLLTIDVGNTNISCGVFDGGKLVTTFRFITQQKRTPDEFALQIHSILEVRRIDDNAINEVIISSVVPAINADLIKSVQSCFGVEPFIVNAAVKTGVGLPSHEPNAIGADLIVDVEAAYDRFKGECLVVDFGTATKFLYVDSEGTFRYCVIAPGLELTASTLWNSTAQLPQVELVKPDSVLVAETVKCMQAGVLYGYLGLTEKIISQFRSELGHAFPVIATGGLARKLINDLDCIDEYDPDLAYKGMKLLYERNVK